LFYPSGDLADLGDDTFKLLVGIVDYGEINAIRGVAAIPKKSFKPSWLGVKILAGTNAAAAYRTRKVTACGAGKSPPVPKRLP
jgi:hypothetical protein